MREMAVGQKTGYFPGDRVGPVQERPGAGVCPRSAVWFMAAGSCRLPPVENTVLWGSWGA